MAVIESVYARQILDSRGNPTVEVVLDTDDGAQGLGLVPSGASTGEAEAWERRDGDKSVYQGKGVLNAVKAVNEEIAPKVIGMDASDQRALDETMIELDGTPNKGRLGANAILGVSLAALYASAESADQPLYRYIGGTNGHILPVPNMNIMNGGAHADFATDIQEYMISPYGFNTYSEALQAGVEVYHTLKNVLKKQGLNTGLGDEGGFAPKMKSNKDSLNYIMDAISAAGYEPGKQIGISLDVASSEFYNKETGKYHFEGDDREAGYMLDFYENLINEYPIVSIEDPFQEEGWDDWAAITAKLGDRLQFVGDDLHVWPRASSSAPPTPCWSSSTRSAPSPRPSTPSSWPPRTASPPWFPTVPARPRTPPSPTWLWQRTPARSRPVPRLVASVSPSTTACSRLRRSSAPPLSTPATALSRPARSTSLSERSQRIMNALT